MIDHPVSTTAPRPIPQLYVYISPVHRDAQGMIGTLHRNPGWETYTFTEVGSLCATVIQVGPDDVRPLAYDDRITMPPPYTKGDQLNYKNPDFDLAPIPVTFVKDDEGWAEITADGGTVTTRYSRLTRR